MYIYIIRHGETDWNKEQRVQGSEDIPLNAFGEELARVTAEKMREIPLEIIYSSPLVRAKKTAEILRGERDIPIVYDARLREMGFGRYEGTLVRIARSDPANPLHDFISHPDRYRARDGEQFSQVIARAHSFIQEVLLPAEGKYENVLLSAHGAFIRCFMRCIEERPLGEFWGGIPLLNCAVTLLELSGGAFRILEEGKVYY